MNIKIIYEDYKKGIESFKEGKMCVRAKEMVEKEKKKSFSLI